MQYVYRVIADDPRPGVISYHKTPASAEGKIISLLRAGSPVVKLEYLRRPLLSFGLEGSFPTPGPTPVVAYPRWFLMTGDAAMVARTEAWQAAGSPKTDNGLPVMPTCEIPSVHITRAVEAMGKVTALPRSRAAQVATARVQKELGWPEHEALALVDLLKDLLR